eukprot:GFUD01010482.1.p1 GENE.GFUD01010482.1~~GFUD01010482.1.p1  ORF type:complete len:656 (-),score=176.01 GFUD01010482.1:29-1996(-)
MQKMTQTDQQIYESLDARLRSIDQHSQEISKSKQVTLGFKSFSVKCAKLPLVTESKFFEAVFSNNNFSDSGQEAFVLKTDEFSMFAFAKVLEFIFDAYDQRSQNVWEYRRRKLEMDLKLDNFQSVVELGSYLQVKSMDDACTQFIVDKLERENVVDVFEMALRLNMEQLTEASKLFVGYHLTDLLPELSLVDTSLDFVRMVLSLEMAKISNESLMLDFIWDWVKCDLETRKEVMKQLFALVRINHVSEKKLKKKLKKIEKRLNLSDFSSSIDLSRRILPLVPARSWPQLMVLCDSLASSDSDLQELSFADIKQLLNQMITTKDLESENSPWESLSPPCLGVNLEVFQEIAFAGGGDSIFVIVKKQLGEEEESDEFELTVWMNDLRQQPSWSKLSQHQPSEVHQMSNIRAHFCWNILFLTGDIRGSSVGYFLDLCSYEPEWRQWTPLLACPGAQHSVAGLCAVPGQAAGGYPGTAGTAGQGTLWVVTCKRRFCSCSLCGGKETHESEKVFPSGKTVMVRQVAGPEDVAQPRLTPYKDTVMAVGGQDPNSRKCEVYDLSSKEWREAASLTEGRSDPGVVTVGTEIYAFGGRGFFWDETIKSVEKINWEDSEGWSKEDGTRVNMGGTLTVVTVNKPLSWMLRRQEEVSVDKDKYSFPI